MYNEAQYQYYILDNRNWTDIQGNGFYSLLAVLQHLGIVVCYFNFFQKTVAVGLQQNLSLLLLFHCIEQHTVLYFQWGLKSLLTVHCSSK